MNYFGERAVDVVVIGAGQAGLSGAYHLRRVGLRPDQDFVVLDHAPRPGGAWQFRWPSLTYGKVHGMHALPGMELTGAEAKGFWPIYDEYQKDLAAINQRIAANLESYADDLRGKTLTDESAMAPAAMAGDNSRPNAG